MASKQPEIILSAIQLCSKPNVEQNLSTIEHYLARLTEEQSNGTSNPNRIHFVVLPECCLFFGGSDKAQLNLAQENAHTDTLKAQLSKLAKTYHVYLIAGSIPVTHTQVSDKFSNTSLVFEPSGDIVAAYEKIHLFDVKVADGTSQYAESTYTRAGTKVVNTQTPYANLGLTVCYDLRFPELFRQLTINGADIITVPAAFTKVTGQAHWQALLQARAIENQVYIIAAAQEGQHNNGRETWGHSMVISPWGEILAVQATGEGIISATFDPERLAQIRASIPVAQHNKFITEMNL